MVYLTNLLVTLIFGHQLIGSQAMRQQILQSFKVWIFLSPTLDCSTSKCLSAGLGSFQKIDNLMSDYISSAIFCSCFPVPAPTREHDIVWSEVLFPSCITLCICFGFRSENWHHRSCIPSHLISHVILFRSVIFLPIFAYWSRSRSNWLLSDSSLTLNFSAAQSGRFGLYVASYRTINNQEHRIVDDLFVQIAKFGNSFTP